MKKLLILEKKIMTTGKFDKNPSLHELTELRQQNAELKAAIEKISVERQQSEENLRVCQKRYSVLFEKSPFPASLSKLPDGIIVDVNKAFEREFGITKQEAVGKTTLELGINPDAEGRKRILENLKESGSVRNQEMVLFSKSGEKHYYETNIDKIEILGEEYLLNTTLNISEYKKAENKLQENYELLRIAGEKAKLGGWNVILNENCSYWSDEVAAIHEMPTGYAPLVEDGINFYAPEWRDKITEVFSKCVQEGIPYDEEMEIITSTGKRVWVRTVGEAVRDKKGKIFKIQGAFQDITLRKQAEEKLKNSEAQYKAIFESTGTATLIVDEDTTILMANNKCFEMFGYSPASLIKQKWSQFVAPESLEEMIKNHHLRRKNPELAPENYEVRLLKNNGEKRDVVLNIKMIPGSKQSVVSMRDITEHKRIEIALRESEERFRMVLQESSIIVANFDTDLRYTWIYNPHPDFNASEVLGKRDSEIADNEGTRQLTALKQLTIDTGLPQSAEIIFPVSTGEKTYAVNVQPIMDASGKIIGAKSTSYDITVIKQAEDELLKAKSNLEQYFENDISADYVVSISGEIFSCNKTFLDLFGFEKKSDTEKFEITNLYKNPNDRKQIIRLIKNKRKVENYEVEFVTKEGKTIYALLNAIGIFDKDDKLEKIRGYIVDINKQKEAENKLILSQERYRRFFEDSITGNYHSTLEGKILMCNDAFVKILKYENKDEILGINSSQLYFQNSVRENFLDKLRAEKKLQNNELTLKARDGSKVEIVENVIGLFDDAGELKEFIGYMWDATARKHAEKEKLKLSYAVEQSPTSVIITDLDGNIEYANPKTLEITGYTKEELIGKNPRLLKSGDTSENEYEKLWKTISSGKEWFGEFHNKKKNGDLYWESASISPILNEKQEIINYVAVKEDITELKKFIADLEIAKEKAEESDRLKSAFLANMSHEIRTPMNGILGFTDLLLNPDLTSEERENYINIVHKSGQRMLNTVNDIVEVSKIEAGIISIRNQKIDINNKVNEMVRFFKPEADKKGLNLIIDLLLPDNKKHVETDEDKLESIISNLIKNAIKYTKSGTMNVGCGLKDACIEFYVKDTGIGIPAHRQEAIFNRFEQADIADTRVFEGSGLGLAIAKSYVEMLGGKIWVESKEEIGSTFYFTLPVKLNIADNSSDEKKNSSKYLKSKPLNKRLKILIAEDDETSRQYLRLLVDDYGNEILEAETGGKALALCQKYNDIDLILMDIQMPGLNGYEATRKIREFNKKVVIIAQTAFALSGDKEKAIEAGCNDYISKPIRKIELEKIIQKYFNNNKTPE